MRAPRILSATAVLSLVFMGSPTIADTTTGHHVEVEIDDPDNPCVPAVGTAFANVVEHFHLAANGSAHGTFTETGSFTLTGPGDVAGATGHYTVWGGFNANPNQFGFWLTLSAHGTKTDGSTFRFNIVIQEREGPKSFEFIQFNCHDGGGPVRIDL